MAGDGDLARIASLMGERARAAMLLALLAGRPQSASALAGAAGVSRPLASVHLRKLVDGGLLVVEPVGRQRFYRLATAVGDAIERLLLLAPPGEVHSLRTAREGDQLRRARLCYDHLAGSVGVAVTEALAGHGWLLRTGSAYRVSTSGGSALDDFGVRIERLRSRGRPLARPCMDWSERRYHLAGSLGAALMTRFLELEWLQPWEASRALRLTVTGRRGLQHWLGLTDL